MPRLTSLGERDPRTGRIVLSPRQTLPTAQAYVREFHWTAEGRTLQSHSGVLLEWLENRYTPVEDEALRCRLLEWLNEALRYVRGPNGTERLVGFESNPTTVNQALESIRAYVHLPLSVVAPSWLGQEAHRPAMEVLSCRSTNVHLPTGDVLPSTPTLFTTNALDFDHDPRASHPEQWLGFLDELFDDDQESIGLLQEWFGYCLIADTRQQKMLLLVGPRRSGKGTLARILTRLVGASNVVGPTTGSLAGSFGLQTLIGKSLAIVSDARFAGEHVATVVERLLCVSGEDTLTVDRKFLGAVSLKLPTRFMFLTNELPRLTDASTALAGRFLVLRLTRSFFGREDPTLLGRLLTELPGILNWSLAGWHRLHGRGRFVQPSSAADSIQELEELASPVGQFVREYCVVMPDLRVPSATLYAVWQMWCEQEGRSPGNKQMFGRDLAAAVPGVKRHRSTNYSPYYTGVGVRSEVSEAVGRYQHRSVGGPTVTD